MKPLFFILALGLSLFGYSQAEGFSACDNKINLDARVKQDPKIERLLCAHREMTNQREGISGYRIQIFSDGGTQSRQRVFGRKRVFDEKHPDVMSYVTYEAPDYKLRVGNFRTRLDAQRFLNQVSRDFPGAYIVIDTIEFPQME